MKAKQQELAQLIYLFELERISRRGAKYSKNKMGEDQLVKKLREQSMFCLDV